VPEPPPREPVLFLRVFTFIHKTFIKWFQILFALLPGSPHSPAASVSAAEAGTAASFNLICCSRKLKQLLTQFSGEMHILHLSDTLANDVNHILPTLRSFLQTNQSLLSIFKLPVEISKQTSK